MAYRGIVYFPPKLPILTGAKENTLPGLDCDSELPSTFPYQCKAELHSKKSA